MNKPKCEECYWWVRSLPKIEKMRHGTCHYNAPTSFNSASPFPRVDADQWCREFSRKPDLG
jgi:hypothetical protein